MKDFLSVEAVETALNNELTIVTASMLEYIEVYNNSPSDIEAQLSELRRFRSTVYESLNQSQHEWLLIKALKWLNSIHNIPLEPNNDYVIQWNPRQTGESVEPDLRIINKSNGLEINCEACTSEKPDGSIDNRIKEHLNCLSKLNGITYYFVLTEKMKQRAESKIRNNGWGIQVIRL